MKKLVLLLAAALTGVAGAMAGVPDLSKVRYSVGEGANDYLLVLRFNVKDRMDNFVYGVKSDKTDLTAGEAFEIVTDADKRVKVQTTYGNYAVTFDLNGDSQIDAADIDVVELMAGNGSLVAADGTTPVLTLSEDGVDASKADYFFYRPEPEAVGGCRPE
ncbi:MAG: hypothetical protein K2K72_07770, partial [Duncaniella sp.]|nr:hypothetical protein [Duncaniella sp.]